MVGLSPNDLYALELSEFSAIYEGWMRLQQQTTRDAWERTRWSTVRLITPHLKPGADVMALCALAWDGNSYTETSGIDPEDIEARRARAEEILASVRSNEQEISIADN